MSPAHSSRPLPTPRRLRFLMGMVVAVLLSWQGTSASLIGRSVWLQFAEHADFIGVVECGTAGTVVARYRVVETWKGSEKPGDEVAIRADLDFNGPYFPVRLVGERLLVAAFRDRAQGDGWFFTGCANPVFPRRIPYSDYCLSYYEGSVRLNDPEGPPQFLKIGSKREELQDVKADFRRYQAMTEEERAFETLRGLAGYWLTHTYLLVPHRSTPQQAEAISNAKSHQAAARKLVAMWDDHDPDPLTRGDLQYRIEKLVSRSNTLTRRLVDEFSRSPKDIIHVVTEGETLESIATRCKSDAGNWSAYALYDTNRSVLSSQQELPKPGTRLELRWREGLHRACEKNNSMSRSKVPDKPEPPTPEALQGAAQTFATNTKYDFTYWQAAALLLNHRPDPVLRWLHDWKPAADAEPPNRIDDYVLGTWAAFHCGGDRTRNLTSLLDANDPLVRVAAAVYLTHEDETAGLAALREMAELPGDAGSWAALNLARRGNRKALERAIEGLGRRTEIEHCHSPIREMLAARLLELLSNSAAAANLAPPILKPYDYQFEDAREFLDQHPDLAPVDPWLPINRDLRTD